MIPLAAVLAFALSAAPSKAPLDRCEATPIEDGWVYDCGDVRAVVQDRPDVGEKAAKALATMLESTPASVGKGAKTRKERRKLGGSDVDLYVTEAPGIVDVKLHAAFPRDAGTRFLLCHGPSGRCEAAFGALGGVPWRSANVPGSIRKDAEPLAIGGRAIAVPEGCTVKRQPRGAGIVCAKTAWVLWLTLDEASARQTLATTGDGLRKILAAPGWKSTEREVPCRLAGARTTCTRVLSESGDDALLGVWAVAPAGEGFAFASCMSRGKKIGSPCSLVFEASEAP